MMADVMVVVIGEWEVLIDCACIVVSEETRREEIDGRSQEEVGVYSCNIIMNTTDELYRMMVGTW